MEKDDSGKQEFLRHFLPAESSLRGYILAHAREFDVADDILQQTALILWRKFEQYDPRRPFLAWALGVARLEMRGAARRARPARSLLEGDLDDLIVGEYVRLESELSVRRQHLRLCLKHLSGSTLDAVRLRYEQGSSLDRIARDLGKSLSAIKVLLHRARLALLECVRTRVSGQEG